jgi:hypothetical protein
MILTNFAFLSFSKLDDEGGHIPGGGAFADNDGVGEEGIRFQDVHDGQGSDVHPAAGDDQILLPAVIVRNRRVKKADVPRLEQPPRTHPGLARFSCNTRDDFGPAGHDLPSGAIWISLRQDLADRSATQAPKALTVSTGDVSSARSLEDDQADGVEESACPWQGAPPETKSGPGRRSFQASSRDEPLRRLCFQLQDGSAGRPASDFWLTVRPTLTPQKRFSASIRAGEDVIHDPEEIFSKRGR